MKKVYYVKNAWLCKLKKIIERDEIGRIFYDKEIILTLCNMNSEIQGMPSSFTDLRTGAFYFLNILPFENEKYFKEGDYVVTCAHFGCDKDYMTEDEIDDMLNKKANELSVSPEVNQRSN